MSARLSSKAEEKRRCRRMGMSGWDTVRGVQVALLPRSDCLVEVLKRRVNFVVVFEDGNDLQELEIKQGN
jgi:hypothetical protein